MCLHADKYLMRESLLHFNELRAKQKQSIDKYFIAETKLKKTMIMTTNCVCVCGVDAQ